MSDLNYTEQQISDLREALTAQGVLLPDHIMAVKPGNFGVCFITEKEVLKLFKTDSKPEHADAEEAYFRRATDALENVSSIADELEKRDIKVPSLIGYGTLPTTITIGNETFHAWLSMSRLDGTHSIQMLDSLLPKNLSAEMADTLEMARRAARLHVQVDVSGKDISDGLYARGKKFDWAEEISSDPKILHLLGHLKNEIENNSPPQEKPTLLHGDFHPENILKSGKDLSVIDWDQQQFGRPEMDVWLFMSLRPQGMKDYVRAYNEIATQPLNEKLVVAYGLTAAVKSYSRHMRSLSSKAGESDVSAHETAKGTDGFRLQIEELAKRLYQLTGQAVYADTARDFSPLRNSQDLLARPIMAHPTKDRQTGVSHHQSVPAPRHTTLPLEGVPYIRHSENDLNLTPIVDQLESMIRQRVAQNPGEPVVVIASESHSTQSHVALQTMLMARFIDPQKNPLRIAQGTEWPHNMVDEILGEPRFDRLPIPDDVRAHIAGAHGDERFFRAYQAVLSQERATETHRNSLVWAERNAVSTRPVDAAWQPKHTLDTSDALTQKIAYEDNPSLIDQPIVPSGSPDAEARYMRIRNLVVGDRVRAHIADTDAEVYFLPFGRSHLLGSQAKALVSAHSPFEDSLVSLFEDPKSKMKLQVFPIFVTLPGRGTEIILPEARGALKQGAVIEGLPPTKFNHPAPIEPGHTFPLEVESLREIYRQSGIAGDMLAVYPNEGLKASFGYGPNFKARSPVSAIGYQVDIMPSLEADKTTVSQRQQQQPFQSVSTPDQRAAHLAQQEQTTRPPEPLDVDISKPDTALKSSDGVSLSKVTASVSEAPVTQNSTPSSDPIEGKSAAPAIPREVAASHMSLEGINGHIGTASIAINLADAAIHGDFKKGAEIVGTAGAVSLAMKGVALAAGVEAVPVAGQVVGAIFAGKDTYDYAVRGHTALAAASGIEATAYAVAASAATITALDCWNPTVVAPAAVALVAGSAALAITGVKAAYNSGATIMGWFGQEGDARDSSGSTPNGIHVSQVMGSVTPTNGRGALRFVTANNGALDVSEPPSLTRQGPASKPQTQSATPVPK